MADYSNRLEVKGAVQAVMSSYRVPTGVGSLRAIEIMGKQRRAISKRAFTLIHSYTLDPKQSFDLIGLACAYIQVSNYEHAARKDAGLSPAGAVPSWVHLYFDAKLYGECCL